MMGTLIIIIIIIVIIISIIVIVISLSLSGLGTHHWYEVEAGGLEENSSTDLTLSGRFLHFTILLIFDLYICTLIVNRFLLT